MKLSKRSRQTEVTCVTTEQMGVGIYTIFIFLLGMFIGWMVGQEGKK